MRRIATLALLGLLAAGCSGVEKADLHFNLNLNVNLPAGGASPPAGPRP